MVDLDELERLANVATPGEWRECGRDNGGCSCCLVWSKLADGVVAKAMTVDVIDGEGFTEAQAKKNAAFIAALNPQIALTLISELRKARERVQSLEVKS